MTSARLRPAHLVVVLALVTVSFLIGMVTGAARISPLQVGAVLLDRLPFVSLDTGLAPVQQSLLVELRLPRVLCGALVGGLLAVAGAGYQGVFRNPLADPYLLGAAAGAGLGTTVVIGFFGGSAALVPLAAFIGALGGVTVAYLLGTTTGRRGTANLVLAGVAVTSFLTAVQAFVQQAKVEELRRIYSWIMGQLTADWGQLTMVAPYALAGVVVLLLHARLLDVLSVGEDEAAALGLHPMRVRLAVLAAASLATASAVAVSGLIGFVGIVVPHIVRRLAGGGNRIVVPLSMFAGAAFMMLTDVAARTLVAPAELPIGVVTAFIGAPIFVLVLRASRAVTP